MKIIGQSSILPIFNRPKKVKKRPLPWRSYVPPDSVDVQLIPRRNLYGRTPLRFRSMGTASTQLRDAVSIYQDEINPFPKDLPSQEELSLRLEEIQEEFEEQKALERFESSEAVAQFNASLPSDEPPEPTERVGVVNASNVSAQVSSARFPQMPTSRPSSASSEEEPDHVRRFADWVQQVTVFE